MIQLLNTEGQNTIATGRDGSVHKIRDGDRIKGSLAQTGRGRKCEEVKVDRFQHENSSAQFHQLIRPRWRFVSPPTC